MSRLADFLATLDEAALIAAEEIASAGFWM